MGWGNRQESGTSHWLLASERSCIKIKKEHHSEKANFTNLVEVLQTYEHLSFTKALRQDEWEHEEVPAIPPSIHVAKKRIQWIAWLCCLSSGLNRSQDQPGTAHWNQSEGCEIEGWCRALHTIPGQGQREDTESRWKSSGQKASIDEWKFNCVWDSLCARLQENLGQILQYDLRFQELPLRNKKNWTHCLSSASMPGRRRVSESSWSRENLWP